jgi:peptide/nickel transport system permease protein
VLALIALIAACADLLASDLPLYCVVDGHSYFLPCLRHPAELRAFDQQTLAARGTTVVSTLVPYGPLAQRPGGRLDVLAAPSAMHWLGTDDRGRDVAARLIHGARVACLVGVLAVTLYLLVGGVVGAACAASKSFDHVASRFIEAGMCIPALFLLLAIQGLSGRGRVVDVALAIALAEWPHAARMVRAEALRVAAGDHVLAARSLGAGTLRVTARHILPLALGPVVVMAGFGLQQAVLFESALGLLGYGISPPTASWGELLAQAMAHPRPWLLLAPSLTIGLVVLASRLVSEEETI